VCERFVQEVRVHDGRFSLVFPPNRTVVVRAPELDCERILSNVIGNAVRYAGKDEIRIEVVRDYSRTIRFLVSDRGPGFPRSVIDAVRLGMPGGGRVKDANGWGVGLVSCKKRLVALGGDLTLESGSGGSTVTIALPEGDSSGAFKSTASEKQPMMASASRAQATDVADADGVPALAQLEHELIIVDDDTDHSESLERVLRRANVLTRTFSSVTEAMAHIERAPHARVVCDVHMPDGGAEKLLQMVTMLGRAVPCAVMSGETSDDVLYRFAALGAREFFAKPASIDRLIAWARV